MTDESSTEAAGPSAGGPAAPQPTGDPRVDAALTRLGELPDLPVGEHVSVYEHVHRRLQDALADLDED